MYITDRSFYTMEAHMGALLYSVEKLISGNLRRLTAFTYDDMIGHCDGWNSLRLSGCHLEQLHLQFRFPRLPAWVGQLSTVMILEIHLDELDMDGIAALAGLPALARLVLKANHVPAGGIVFSRGAVFRALTYFAAPQAGLPFHFQAGAMPMVKILCFPLHVRELNYVARLHGGGGTEAIELNHALLLLRKGRPYAWLASHVQSIEHLSNLTKVFICLGYSRSRSEESQVPIIEAAIRSFFDEHHPGAPTIHVTSYPYLYDD
ncbi:unnamed protein product [Miscanthus lutarioriparius]|uniref:Disease resistance R13L4/SHOC-2-like LRR domain-containing protein n=1 Tax=Miscanthus lutarioriparius TaxID=422564 RepID=A0A811R772_9POAL|nr:unnamed protein product [Miscanthus lutarioriparius]